MIIDKLNELSDFMLTNDISKEASKTDLFGGAGIVIIELKPEIKEGFYPDPKYVVTKYAKELSWLIFKLKEIFKGELDHINKFDFYKRLARKANISIMTKGDNLKTLLFDVLDAAEDMVDNLD